jgi:choice-of-anchor C domain-containing protein
MKRLQVIILTTILILGLGGVAYAASFSNGSFESGNAPGPSFITLGAGSTAINSWSINSGAIDYIGGYWTASDGNRSVDLNATVPGVISQTFDTLVGKPYEVLFDLAGNPAGGPTVKQMQVSAAGNFQNYDFDITGNSLSSMGWIEKSFEFNAVGTETTLTFSSLITGAYGPAIDNVRVNVVPIPAAIWLLGSGLIGMAGFRRKFRKG